MEEETSVKREFGSHFEEKIVHVLLGDESYAEQMLDVVDPELFELTYTKELVNQVKKYYEKYEAIPTPDLLETICKQNISNEATLKKCNSYLKKIKEKPSLNGDAQYVKDNSLSYFKTQHLKSTLINDVAPKIQKQNFNEIMPVIQAALRKGEDKNIGLEYDKDENRFVERKEKIVPTPWKILNKYLDGGFKGKRLVTLAAPQGAGKTHYLVNIGIGALLAGKTVVHYTLEIEDLELARRYDANLCDLKINQVPGNKSKVMHLLGEKLPKDAKLIIKEYPEGSASTNTFKSHLAKLRIQGIVPDIVLVDYGSLMEPSTQKGTKRDNYEQIWKDLRAEAKSMGIPWVTVSQINRDGMNEEVIYPDKIGEDITQYGTSDQYFTMARNFEQKQIGFGKILFAKNRQGEDGMILGYTLDTHKSKMKVFELTEDIEEKLQNLKEKDTADKLADYLRNGEKNEQYKRLGIGSI